MNLLLNSSDQCIEPGAYLTGDGCEVGHPHYSVEWEQCGFVATADMQLITDFVVPGILDLVHRLQKQMLKSTS